ncbi:MAG: MFS transporter [Paracoccus sp. (in: a-proteobacteria)]|uniref:MFS transporter n=1 Tax=Paracoccus sp. TaxID=267 RepID=UPI0026DF6447|nr:MFS transporter [Paracoccus sp. (in: a-proteobacteria)]MDO5620105.1 MFS transporter [Paracoccus sp. (in: a-proteobacteria)]
MGHSVDDILGRAGAGPYQRKLFGVFGMVWAADAMQVLAVGFTAVPLAATFGLTVPQALQTGTLFFLGMFFGAALFGRLADRIGRRRVLLLTVTCDAVFGLASVFANDFTLLLALRFLTGVAVGGTLPVDYAMMAEFLPPKSRGRWLVWLEGFWAVGTIIIAATAWICASLGVQDAWRWIYAVAAFPALIGIWLRLWIPESPMFLLRQGDEPAARAVVDRVLIGNGVAPMAVGERLIAPPMPEGRQGLFRPDMLRTTLAVLALWFLVSLSYYGVFVWLPAKLAGEGFGWVRGYGFLLVLALAQVPGYALAAYGVERWGRKPTLQLFLTLSALGCAGFALASTPVVIAATLMLMSFALLGTWGALYAFTPELYPTRLRGTGMGLASATARLGGLAAPSLLGAVIARDFTLAIGLFAALLLAAALVTLAIRQETRDEAIG